MVIENVKPEPERRRRFEFQSPQDEYRAAVVLSGGDSRRLASFVRRLRGDALPKQYVTLYGAHSLLERTFERVERLVPPDRIMTTVTRDHLRHADACRQLAGRPLHTVVVQPRNRDTGPGLLLSLAHLHRRREDALVAVFPSDHYVSNDSALVARVETAFEVVKRRPDLVVLLGVPSNAPDSDYGYLMPGHSMDGDGVFGVRSVRRFIEQPTTSQAEFLVQNGALWNTSILVFQLQMLRELMACVAPMLWVRFMEIAESLDTPSADEVIEEVYQQVPAVSLSRGILESVSDWSPSRLAVVQLEEAFWSDWGVEQRILRDLYLMGGDMRPL
jgi:mannose-1-phosphate guanylyltransferase